MMRAPGRLSWIALASALASSAGCGLQDAGADAPAPHDATRADSGAAGCDGTLELGLCQVVGTTSPCVGGATEVGEFVSVADGSRATLVLGPQGSRMLVLAARTTGIEPGDPARPADSGNPVVEVRVTDGAGDEVTSYRGRAAFEPDPRDPSWLVHPEIFVIMEGSLPASVWVSASLRDRLGQERCGRLELSMSP